MPAFFNTARNGYNQEEVDGYIKNLEKSISDYRDKDAAIANTLVNAQIAADNIIKNADLAAKSIKQEAVDQLERIADSLENQRRMISDFQKDYDDLVEKYLHKVKQNDFDEVLTRVEELDAYLYKLRNNTPEPAPTFAPAPASAPISTPTPAYTPTPAPTYSPAPSVAPSAAPSPFAGTSMPTSEEN